MKAVAGIVAAVILLVSGGYVAPKIISLFKIETILKVDQALSSLSDFSERLSRR